MSSLLFASSSIFRHCLHPFARSVTPSSMPYLFSLLSSHHAIPPPQDGDDDDDAATTLHNPQTPTNLISEFLVKECGLSPSQLTRVMRKRTSLSRVRSTETARGAVQVLRDSGFTSNQVINTILGNPSILVLKAESQLKPKIGFLKALGLTGQYLKNTICKAPGLFGLSLENNLVPKILYLEKLFGSKDGLCKAIRWAPDLLRCNVENRVKPKLDLLKQCGVKGELLSLLISEYPQILTRTSDESLKLRLDKVKNMGILEGSKTFIDALLTVVKISPENIEKKRKNLAALGLLDNEIHELLKKRPRVLTISMNKIQENMYLLTHTAGLPSNIVVSYSSLLTLSVEKRLKPRHEVFKALRSLQQSKRLPSLLYIFKMSEQEFLKKFLECSPHASILKKIYKGK